MPIPTGIITVSDRAAAGLYEDRGGPGLKQAAEGYGWSVTAQALVPDETPAIQQAVCEHIANGCRLVLTTGGTGAAPRDVTPEAVRALARCELPGFGEVMRQESLKLTPHAMLSRCLAVVVGRTLVVCLPGSPRGAVECLSFVATVIPHCLETLDS